MVTWTDIKDGLTYLPRAVATDSKRLYGGTKEVLINDNGGAVDPSRRDYIKGAGGFLLAGATPGKDVVEDAADASPVGVRSPIEFRGFDGSDAPDDGSKIDSYDDFSDAIEQLSQEDREELRGALSADPNNIDDPTRDYVEDVSFNQDEQAVYVDSVAIKYEDISGEMEETLREADNTGNLETWLGEYERRMD